MKLDSRIIKGKKPLDCFDIDIAKQFIGKKGFFGVHESQFMDFDTCPKCVVDELKEVDNYDDCPFITSGNYCYKLFLPLEWIEQQKSKINFEAYNLVTFENEFNIGDVVTFRGKTNTDRVGSYYKCVYSGYRFITEKGSTNTIAILGLWAFSFSELFDLYEIYRNGNWEPFGRKTNEG